MTAPPDRNHEPHLDPHDELRATTPDPPVSSRPEPHGELGATSPDPHASSRPEPHGELGATSPDPHASSRPEPHGELGATSPDPHASSHLDPHGELRAVVDDCVHCGFCLPACPTYQLWGEEMDSPRGRIHLIGQLLDGAQASPAAAIHLDRCLGCMACVPACPSGVRYDRLIEAARAWATEPVRTEPVRALPPRSRRERALRAAIFATFPYPGRLRVLTGPLHAAQRAGLDRLIQRSDLASRLLPEVTAALAVAPGRPSASPRGPKGSRTQPAPRGPDGSRTQPAPRGPDGSRTQPAPRGPDGSRTQPAPRGPDGSRTQPAPRGRLPERVAARGQRRAVVGMLTGCVQQVFFPQVNAATARVLAAEGCDVVIPAGQGCCGALSLHDGRRAEAARFARALIDTFERAGVDAIVVNSAGCGSAMKEYADLLAGDDNWAGRAAELSAKVADLSEFLVRIGPAAARHPLALTVAYHDACHLAHAQRITSQPRELLRAIPGLTITEIADAGTCCGSAGIYNLVQPNAAAELGARKAEAVSATGADLVVSGNPGCALQIASALRAQGAPLPVAHIVEVLDASIRARPASSLLLATLNYPELPLVTEHRSELPGELHSGGDAELSVQVAYLNVAIRFQVEPPSAVAYR